MSNETERTEARRIPRVRPASDIVEREDGFHIFMDMPGVHKEDLSIDLNKNEISVSAPVKNPMEVGDSGPSADGRRYMHVEFGSGIYSRTFTLADTVDRERITASLVNGVLDLYLPKSEQAKPKRIEIQGG